MSVWWNGSVRERGNVCVCVFISLTAGYVQRSCPPAVIWLWQCARDMSVCSRSPHLCVCMLLCPLHQSLLFSSLFLSSAPLCILFPPNSLLSMSRESWQISLTQHYVFSTMEMRTDLLTVTKSTYAHTYCCHTHFCLYALSLWPDGHEDRQTLNKKDRQKASQTDI